MYVQRAPDTHFDDNELFVFCSGGSKLPKHDLQVPLCCDNFKDMIFKLYSALLIYSLRRVGAAEG